MIDKHYLRILDGVEGERRSERDRQEREPSDEDSELEYVDNNPRVDSDEDSELEYVDDKPRRSPPSNLDGAEEKHHLERERWEGEPSGGDSDVEFVDDTPRSSPPSNLDGTEENHHPERERWEGEPSGGDSDVEFVDGTPKDFLPPDQASSPAARNTPPTHQAPDRREGDEENVRTSNNHQRKEPVGIVIPWDDDTFQDKDMRLHGLVAYTPLHILICVDCHSVVDPDLIRLHVRRHHRRTSISHEYCLGLRNKFSLTPKARLKGPSTPRPAIPCLELKEGYVYCTGCNHAMEHMRSLKTKHSCVGFEIKECFAQTFFPHIHQGGYFPVTVSPQRRELQPVDFVQTLNNAFPNPNPENLPIALPENPRDANHFLELQGWVPTLCGCTGAELWIATREINPDVRSLVSGSIKEYMSKVDYDLSNPKNHTVQCAMASYTGLVSSHSLSFEIVDEADRELSTTDRFDSLHAESSRRVYCKAGTDLVTFVVGACMDRLGDKIHVETTAEQKECAQRYLNSVQRSDGSEVDALQDLLYSVFTQRSATLNPHDFLVYRFFVFYSFRRDGSIQQCNNITQIVSWLVFFARGCIYRHIKSVMDATGDGFFT